MNNLLEKISKAANREARIISYTRTLLTGLNALLLAGIAILFEYRPILFQSEVIGPIGFWGLIGIIIIIYLCFSHYVVAQSPHVVEVYFDAKKIEKKYKKLQRENQGYMRDVKYFSLFAEACNQWQLFQTALKQKKAKPSPEKIADHFFAIIIEAREDFFDFTPKEYWNFALYLYDEKEKLLVQTWRKMSSRHPANKKGGKKGRSWAPGVGHTGKAFFDNRTIITRDSADPEVKALMELPDNMVTKSYTDEEVYKSYAAIPISLKDGEPPLGIILATSNVKNRFNKANCLILKQLSRSLYHVLSD